MIFEHTPTRLRLYRHNNRLQIETTPAVFFIFFSEPVTELENVRGVRGIKKWLKTFILFIGDRQCSGEGG